MYSTFLENGRACAQYQQRDRHNHQNRRKGSTPKNRRLSTFLYTILLLCGDVHLNPGPGDFQQTHRDAVYRGYSATPDPWCHPRSTTRPQSDTITTRGNSFVNPVPGLNNARLLTTGPAAATTLITMNTVTSKHFGSFCI